MKAHVRRVRCIKCGKLFPLRRTYPTKSGPVHDECWEQDVRTGERMSVRKNKVRDEDNDE